MASIRTIKLGGGRLRYQVRWRQDGKSTSETFDAHSDAVQFRGMVDAAGQRYPEGWVPRKGFAQTSTKGMTLAEWFPMALAARTRASERTKDDYRRDFERHVPPWLAGKEIAKISRVDGGIWLAELQATKTKHGLLTPKTISNVHGMLSSVLNDALLDGHIDRNPLKGQLRQLEKEHREMTILTPLEVRAVVDAMPEQYKDFVAFLYGTGARFGEAMVLTPAQVDLKARTVSIEHAWKRTAGGGVVGPPKSRRSVRKISITTAMTEMLSQRMRQELLFQNSRGTRITHGNFYAKFWTPALEASEIGKKARVHDLRHSHAAFLISQGVPLLAISRRLGHASISVTGDVYGHLLPDVDDGIRSVLEGPEDAED